MKVADLVKATRDSEAGVMPTNELSAAMGRFNDSLIKAGILLAGEALKPRSVRQTSALFRRFANGIERPVHRPEGARGGFLAIAGALHGGSARTVRRCRNPMPTDSENESRPLYEPTVLS